MKMTICDRCGEHFTEYPWQAMIVPDAVVFITESLSFGGIHRRIDLCRGCKAALVKWIKGDEREDIKEGGDGDDVPRN